MNCERRFEDYLRENEMPYQTQHHPRAITAQEVATTEHVPGRMFAKTVMVSTDGGEEAVMLALPAPFHVGPKKAAEALRRGEGSGRCEFGPYACRNSPNSYKAP